MGLAVWKLEELSSLGVDGLELRISMSSPPRCRGGEEWESMV
jgi:hypothetical protein